MPWTTAQLGEVIRLRKEFITIDDAAEYKRCRVQLHAKGVVLRDIVPGADIKTKEQQLCRAGEFLVAEIDAKVGGFGIVPDDLDGAIVSSHYFLFTIDQRQLERRFLDFYARTPAFREQVTAQGTTNYAAIRPSHVLGYTISLPPLPEQRRIVAKVEQLAAKIEAATNLRRTLAEASEALMPSAIKAAVTDHWPSLPLHAVVDPHRGITYGIVQAGPHVGDGVPYIRVSDMASSQLTLAGMLRTAPEIARRYRRSMVRAGDVVIAIRATVGRVRIVPDELDGANLTQGTARIAPSSRAGSRYLFWCAQSPQVVEQIDDACKGSTFREITLGKLRQIILPVPPVQDQRRIVAYLDGLQAKVDSLKALQAQSAAELDALLPSILDKAFKGEL